MDFFNTTRSAAEFRSKRHPRETELKFTDDSLLRVMRHLITKGLANLKLALSESQGELCCARPHSVTIDDREFGHNIGSGLTTKEGILKKQSPRTTTVMSVNSPQSAKSAGRKPESGSKYAGEVERVSEPGLLRHLFHQGAGPSQALGGVIHF
jgi:hypothetical protein